MIMDSEKYIDLYSQSRLNGYSSIDEHEQNFQMLDKIASKLGRIEIIIRNRIDRKMSQSNKDWLFNLPDDIRLDVGDKMQDLIFSISIILIILTYMNPTIIVFIYQLPYFNLVVLYHLYYYVK